MTLDDYKKQQRKSHADFMKLVKTDKKRAKDIAKRRLLSVGIIGSDDAITSR